jgi:murein L,D-transpeptidase YcbB/YkuD
MVLAVRLRTLALAQNLSEAQRPLRLARRWEDTNSRRLEPPADPPVHLGFITPAYEYRLMLNRFAFLLAAASVSGSALARPTHPIEPVEIPPSIQQGVDLIYIDPEIAPALRERDALLSEIGFDERAGAPIDLVVPLHPLFTELRRGLAHYRATWSRLPQLQIPPGPVLKPGDRGERVGLLRERLGIPPGTLYDEALATAVRRYQQAHGLQADGISGADTIASLNLGARHFERLVTINLERARRLPGSADHGRYVLVDAGAAQLYLFENGRLQDTMRAIVGKSATPTPMMAASIRYASVNPYWNVPPDLVQSLIAPRVLAEGIGYLEARRYQLMSDWSEEARVVDPATVDWAAVADGREEPRIRQLPGPGNSMGNIKFMMPNDFGIYLHDTPDKALFQRDDRWISNGCIRVEDARRLAAWLFGHMPEGSNPDTEEEVQLDSPVPVYITYLTVGTSADGIVFRRDPYSRDAAVLARHFGSDSELNLTAR